MRKPQSPSEIQEVLQEGNAHWGYRRADDGEIESCVFTGEPPAGWHGSPADCTGSNNDPDFVPWENGEMPITSIKNKDELEALATDKGHTIDKRKKLETLQAEVAALYAEV